jgi:hypothetical protein
MSCVFMARQHLSGIAGSAALYVGQPFTGMVWQYQLVRAVWHRPQRRLLQKPHVPPSAANLAGCTTSAADAAASSNAADDDRRPLLLALLLLQLLPPLAGVYDEYVF